LPPDGLPQSDPYPRTGCAGHVPLAHPGGTTSLDRIVRSGWTYRPPCPLPPGNRRRLITMGAYRTRADRVRNGNACGKHYVPNSFRRATVPHGVRRLGHAGREPGTGLGARLRSLGPRAAESAGIWSAQAQPLPDE